MPRQYMPDPDSPEPNAKVVSRYLNSSGVKWSSRDIPNKSLGISSTSETQTLFDSGYLGDDGLENSNLRLHVYDGSLTIETHKETDGHIADINIESAQNILIASKNDTVIEPNNMTTAVKNNSVITIGGSYKETIAGLFGKTSVITGSHGYQRDVIFNTKITTGNYDITSRGNYFINSETGTFRLATKEASLNSSQNTTINSTNELYLKGGKKIDITGGYIVESSDTSIEMRAPNTLKLTFEKILSNDMNVNQLTSIYSKKLDLKANEEFSIITNGVMNQIITKKYTIKANDYVDVDIVQDLNLKANNIIEEVVNNKRVNAINITMSTENKGDIHFIVGNKRIKLNEAELAIDDSAKLIDSTYDFKAPRVFNAVYM